MHKKREKGLKSTHGVARSTYWPVTQVFVSSVAPHRCARLNLLCKPNPRKPGRPSRQLKPQSPMQHYPSGAPAAQFPYHHVPPANHHASCYCLPPAGAVNAPSTAPSTGRPNDPKHYSMHPLMPYPLTGLPLPHGSTACAAPAPYQHYHSFQLTPQPPNVTSPSGPTPQVGVGDEEWTEVCQLLSDMPVPPSPTGTNTAIINTYQVRLPHATTCFRAQDILGRALGARRSIAHRGRREGGDWEGFFGEFWGISCIFVFPHFHYFIHVVAHF